MVVRYTRVVSDVPFEQIGGEPGVRALVDDFYDRMDQLPEAATIRALPERDQWLLCMRGALAVCVADPTLRAALEGAFERLADHMRNREPDAST